MTILQKPSRPSKIIVDLTGPDGNAFVLIGIAAKIGKQLGLSSSEIEDIKKKMMSGDYENLVNTLEEEFGSHIVMYR